MTPYQVNMGEGCTIPVPCGKCPACLSRRVSGWSFRLIQEDKHAESSHFITLTYDTSHVHITRNGFMSLCKRDLQLFFKRLRKNHSGNGTSGIKYYAVGEYGGRTRRPHYHIILFNSKVELIQPSWQKGQVHYGQVSGASVGYTLKYMTKPKKWQHKNDDREPEFSIMSKGLGASYLTEKMVEWHKADLEQRMYCNIDGKKIAMPRYYKNKIYDERERAKISSAQRQQMNEDNVKLILANGGYYNEHGYLVEHPDWNRWQSQNVLAAFEKMYKNANKNRNKI